MSRGCPVSGPMKRASSKTSVIYCDVFVGKVFASMCKPARVKENVMSISILLPRPRGKIEQEQYMLDDIRENKVRMFPKKKDKTRLRGPFRAPPDSPQQILQTISLCGV